MENKEVDLEFKKVKTGNGFQNDLIATTNNRLELVAVETRKLKEAIVKLETTIVILDEKNEKLQKRIFWLTVVAVVFAIAQIAQVIDIVIQWLK